MPSGANLWVEQMSRNKVTGRGPKLNYLRIQGQLRPKVEFPHACSAEASSRTNSALEGQVLVSTAWWSLDASSHLSSQDFRLIIRAFMDRVFGDDWDCNEGVQTVTRCPLANRDQCWPLLVVSPGSSPRWWGSRIPDLSKSALLCLWQFSELLCVENESSAGKSVTSPATDVPFGWTLDASCRKCRTWRGCRGPISEKIVRNITSSSTLAKDISISSATSERRATSRKKKIELDHRRCCSSARRMYSDK